MTAEDLGTEGVDFFGDGLSEQLFDTPSADRPGLALVGARRRTMTVSVGGRPATRTAASSRFEWRLLQGDPRARDDRAAAEDGRSARDHPRLARALPASPTTTRSRPPGSTSASSPTTACTTAPRRSFPGTSRPRRRARYAPGPDGTLRIDRDRPRRPATAAYADPMLIPRADWRDDYHYAADGTLPAGRGCAPRPGDRPPRLSTRPAGACPTRRTRPPRSRSPIRCRGPRTAGSWSTRRRRALLRRPAGRNM